MYFAQNIRKEILDSMETFKTFCFINSTEKSAYDYHRYKWLKKAIHQDEIKALSESTNPITKAYAFKLMIDKNDTSLVNNFISLLKEEPVLLNSSRHGGWGGIVEDEIFLTTYLFDRAYSYIDSEEKKDLIDSICLFGNDHASVMSSVKFRVKSF
jgi:hypothetical protein